MINWIFFDVGNVILNDDPAMAKLYKLLHEIINNNNHEIPLKELLRLREQLIRDNRDGQHYKTIAKTYLGEKKWKKEFLGIISELNKEWDKHSPLIPGVLPVIKELYKQYNLGLIANQPKEVIRVLGKYDLIQYFKVTSISQVIGFYKPDNRIYKYAITEAGTLPDKSIMIGDRIDNDIFPAKSIGMKTIWLKLSLDSKEYIPQTEYERLYFQSVEKASASRIQPQNEIEIPDFIATSFENILKGVNKIDGK